MTKIEESIETISNLWINNGLGSNDFEIFMEQILKNIKEKEEIIEELGKLFLE